MESLIAYLEKAVGAGLARSGPAGFGMLPRAVDTSLVKEIVRDLLAQALAAGLPVEPRAFDEEQLGGGNTADVVRRVVLHAPFVFKMDRNEKLAKEAGVMRQIRSDGAMPKRFREAWPVIYAIRTQPPYAYLMEYFPEEDGWVSLEDRLFPGKRPVDTPAEALRQLNAILDVLFEGYEASVDKRARPVIRQDYVGRIRERLDAAARADGVFRSRGLKLNGRMIAPWEDDLRRLESLATLETFSPPFTTVVHGDPNPGNLLTRSSLTAVEVKLIDPKDWRHGDYLFDIAKITHFLEATGPIEKPRAAGLRLDLQAAKDTDRLDYAFNRPRATKGLVDACLDRVAAFAKKHGDVQWRARYDLAMAANILGLPATRYAHPTRPRREAAVALYGEGLAWLGRFCARLP